MCYYGSWSVYRPGRGKFRVEDIDPNICTHIVYAFGGIEETGKVKALDPWNDIGDEWHEGNYGLKIFFLKTSPMNFVKYKFFVF